MSCNYAEGLSPYDNKGRLGAPEKFDSAPDIRAKVDQLADMVKHAKHIGKQTHIDFWGVRRNFIIPFQQPRSEKILYYYDTNPDPGSEKIGYGSGSSRNDTDPDPGKKRIHYQENLKN